ncbi:MAG: aspartate dehydrogenase [Neisseriaceae bacterium]
MKKLMMIGFGAMGQTVLAHLPEGLSLAWVVVPERSIAKVSALVGADVAVMADVAECAEQPDLVIEVAGQAGVRAHAAAVLRRGWNMALISVGALADAELAQSLATAATEGGGTLTVLAGAVAGMDGLAAAKEGGLDRVVYQGCKSPSSWQGSHAETLIDLANVTQKTVFFTGSAREAATLFPANANVAATIALAGLGMDETQVELTVDPDSHKNQHRIEASGRFGQMSIELAGVPLPSNPKTSTLAALSVVRACRLCLSGIKV